MTQLFLDVECYPNYFLVMFSNADGRTKSFELYEDHPLDVEGLDAFLSKPGVEYVTFNGKSYDEPMITLALSGASNAALKKASDAIIMTDLKPWEFYDAFGLNGITFNHIDLIEVAPGMASLKIYGGRMHSKKLQDLPIEPDAQVRPEERMAIKHYCRNDLMVTAMLFAALSEQIELRRVMSKEIGVDVRSKSDAQIAEAVMRKAYIDANGSAPRKTTLTYGSFLYEAPDYVGFGSEMLNHALYVLTHSPMVIKETGHVEMPTAIENLDIRIGGTKYKIGIGGLHSQESEVCHIADEKTILRDIDVVSYYPSMMLNIGMYPPALGPMFLEAYGGIRTERITAKRAGDKVKSDVLKITLNGTFGKTSNKYSILYNPKFMIHTTLTGQLNLLMLIEALDKYGIPVVSANTDGIVVKCPVAKETVLRKVVSAWERLTNLETEETNYKAVYSRDVNSYIAIKTDGKVKAKGAFAIGGLAKSPQNEICTEAVINLLSKGIPVEETIRYCTDIRKFLTLRTVNGGAVKEGYTLGKAIRWYYAVGMTGTINYKTTGKIVGRTEGAKPLMDLPDEMPSDVDFDWYIREAHDLLMDVAYTPRPPKVKLPRKNSKAWKEMFESATS